MKPFHSLAFAALVIAALLTFGCGTGDIHLKGDVAKQFRNLIGHDGITISEKTTIYGTANPPSACMVAHEKVHQRQAKVIGDLLAGFSIIDDDEPSRMAAWLALYLVDAAQYGYTKNRWEKEARKACP